MEPKPSSRIDDIVSHTIALIESGALKPGDRLPSIRAAAVARGVAKNTLVEAYDRLVALGHLESRRGSGFFVARARRRPAAEQPRHVIEALDLVWLLREQLEQTFTVRVGEGRPPPSWTDDSELGRHLRAVSARPRALEHGYGHPAGYRPLRERLALLLAERSISAAPEQILLTHGANHALDLIVRHLLEPGEVALVDSPGYYPLFGKLKLAKVGLVGVRRLPQGPDLDDLAEKAAATGAKVFFTQSLAHNPTGGSITLPVAHRILQVAERHGLTLVEDDPFADVLPAASPRLAALDQLQRVIYVGTFAKTLSASLRSGYVAANPAVINALTAMKMLTTVNSSAYVERLIFDLIAAGHYRHHLRRLRERIERAARTAVANVEALGLGLFAPASGGYYIYGQLPPRIDDLELSRRAADKGIFLAPGSVFLPDRPAAGGGALRINIGYADSDRFLQFMREALAQAG